MYLSWSKVRYVLYHSKLPHEIHAGSDRQGVTPMGATREEVAVDGDSFFKIMLLHKMMQLHTHPTKKSLWIKTCVRRPSKTIMQCAVHISSHQ